MATQQRPLSPHLQIYAKQITSTMSILHRMTGIVNALGVLVLAWWLVALASGGEAYAQFIAVVGSLPGQSWDHSGPRSPLPEPFSDFLGTVVGIPGATNKFLHK